MIRIKITVRTPPNKAEECLEKNKKVFLGKIKDKIIEEGIINHNEFFWVLDLESDTQLQSIYKKCAIGEVTIKKFYSTLIKTIKRANYLGKKFSKGLAWIRRRITKTINKMQGEDKKEFLSSIESMTDQELNEWIEIEDEEEMKTFLSKPIFSIDQV